MSSINEGLKWMEKAALGAMQGAPQAMGASNPGNPAGTPAPAKAPAPAPQPAPAPAPVPAPAPAPQPQITAGSYAADGGSINVVPNTEGAPSPALTGKGDESSRLAAAKLQAENPGTPIVAPKPVTADVDIPANNDYSKIFGKNFNPETSRADAWLKAQADEGRRRGLSDDKLSVMLGPDAWRKYGRNGENFQFGKSASAPLGSTESARRNLFDSYVGLYEELSEAEKSQYDLLADRWNNRLQ